MHGAAWGRLPSPAMDDTTDPTIESIVWALTDDEEIHRSVEEVVSSIFE
jgi:hypothetical protein